MKQRKQLGDREIPLDSEHLGQKDKANPFQEELDQCVKLWTLVFNSIAKDFKTKTADHRDTNKVTEEILTLTWMNNKNYNLGFYQI